jgi:protein TonB
MFNNLMESKKKRQKSLTGQFWSLVAHVGLVTGAVYATAHAADTLQKPKEEKVDFVEVKKEEAPKPKAPPPPELAAVPPPPLGHQVLTAPVEIPNVLPDIDLTKSVTNEADFSGKGATGGFAKGVERKADVKEDQPYFEFQVEKPVAPIPGTGNPKYPDILRQAGVEGDVLVTFVVDTSGRADPSTFKVIRATHELFANAVKQALPAMRFTAAEVAGKKVKQLVQQPFSFTITK